MPIEWNPKIGKTGVQSPAAAPSVTGNSHSAANLPTPQPMEKPAMLAEPEAAHTHPTRASAATKPSSLEIEVNSLRTLLRTSKPSQRLDIANKALALAAGYKMRRSRGARSLAFELCDAVSDTVDELQTIANTLKAVLTAEGDLHETSADGTLRACRALVALLDEEKERS